MLDRTARLPSVRFAASFFALWFAAAAPALAQEAETATLTIRATVPEGSGTVYLPGSLPELGPWDPAGFAMDGEGTVRTATLRAPEGTVVEFKLTLGSWESEALAKDGSVPPNHSVLLDGDKTVEIAVPAWREVGGGWAQYLAEADAAGGAFHFHPDFPSENLGRARHVIVWTPPGYEENPEQRFAVLYMHDGQNLFVPERSFTGVDWGADEAAARLMREGRIEPLMIVGAFCTADRMGEYASKEGRARYAAFLAEELKPFIDANYRTLPGPEHTGTMGSSLGGRISLYLGKARPDVFGKAACLSNALMSRPGDHFDDILGEVEAEGYPQSVKLYFDYGTAEHPSFAPLNGRLAAALESRGWTPGEDFLFHVEAGASHAEAAWRDRLEVPLAFLFGQPPAEK